MSGPWHAGFDSGTIDLSQVSSPVTTTTVISSANPSQFGQSVTFTATVMAAMSGSGTPTGTVTFTIDGTAKPAVTLTGDTATFSISTLTVASSPHTHTVSATYNPATAANFTTSTGTLTGGQTVNQAATITLTFLDKTPIRSSDPGINFSYFVSSALLQGATINFYWASGNSLDDKTDTEPAYTYSINTPTLEAEGSHGAIPIPRSDFTDVPYGTTYLVATVETGGATSTLGVHLFQPITVNDIVSIVPPPMPPTPVTIPSGRLTKLRREALIKAERKYEKDYKTYQQNITAYVKLAGTLVGYLNSKEAFETYQINYPERLAGFIGQVPTETDNLRSLSQYGKFKNEFDRGRGYLQITGKSNYKAAGDAIGVDLASVRNLNLLVSDPLLGARASGWFWNQPYWKNEFGYSMNEFADMGNFTAISQLVNGGHIGADVNKLEDRITDSENALDVLLSNLS